MDAEKQGVCPCCGGRNLEENPDHGVVVCMDCGTAAANEFSEGQEPVQTPSPRFLRTQEPTVEQIRVFAEKHYTYRKMCKVTKHVTMIAETMKLPRAKTKICVDQAKELVKRHAIGKKGLPFEHVAAALVFMAWKSENACVTAWDMGPTGLGPNKLMQVTHKLCFHHPDLVSVTLHKPLTDEERLNLRLERFPPIPAEERRRVIQVALDIWTMVCGVKVQDFYLGKSPGNDYSILGMALQHVRRRALTRSEVAKLSDNISMTGKTFYTRLWVIKKALLTLASQCPCLEADVRNRVITTQTVHRYLDRLFQNKEYLINEVELINQMEEEEEEKEEEEEEEGEEPVSKKRKRKRRKRVRWCKIRRDPTVHADGDTSQGGGGEGGGEEEEDDGNLSDLDNDELDEYILTEKEVEIRKHLLSTGDESPTQTPT